MLVSIYWGGRYIRLKRQLRGKPDQGRLDDMQQASEEPAANQTDNDSPVPADAESPAPAIENGDVSLIEADSAINQTGMERPDAQLAVAEQGTADRPI